MENQKQLVEALISVISYAQLIPITTRLFTELPTVTA